MKQSGPNVSRETFAHTHAKRTPNPTLDRKRQTNQKQKRPRTTRCEALNENRANYRGRITTWRALPSPSDAVSTRSSSRSVMWMMRRSYGVMGRSLTLRC